VIAASVQPAEGTQAKVGDTVAYTYFIDYAPIPYDPAWVTGQPGDTACGIINSNGFQDCTATPGQAAPTRTQANQIYAIDPAAAGNISPLTRVTISYYGSARSAPAGSFPNGCADVDVWMQQTGVPSVTCSEAAGGPPGGYNAVTSQTPAPGADLGSGDAVVLYRYQPAAAPVNIWAQTDTGGAAQLINVQPDAGWASSGVYNFLASAEAPGSAPVTCWVSTVYGTTGKGRYQCNATGSPPGFQGGWSRVDTGVFAWTGDPGGGARLLTSCELIRTKNDGSETIFLAQSWRSDDCSPLQALPGPTGYTDAWVYTFAIYILP